MAILSIFAPTEEMTATTKAFDEKDIHSIEIRSDNSNIDFVLTDEQAITVEYAYPVTKNKKFTMDTKLRDGRLIIKTKEKRTFFLFQLNFGPSPRLTVYIPKKQYDSVDMNVVNGKVDLNNLSISSVDVETTNGNINLTEMVTKSTSVSSHNGKVLLNKVNGDIRADVTNGSIHLDTEHLDQNIKLNSVNGRIRVQTDNKPTNATIAINVVNGKANIFGNDTTNMIIGEGLNKVNLSTVNGSVTVTD